MVTKPGFLANTVSLIVVPQMGMVCTFGAIPLVQAQLSVTNTEPRSDGYLSFAPPPPRVFL